MEAQFRQIPGIITEYMILSGGPASAKPIHLRLTGTDFDVLGAAVETVEARMHEVGGIVDIEDSRPLPGTRLLREYDGVQHVVTVRAAKDRAGNALVAPFTATFTVTSNPDAYSDVFLPLIAAP